MAITWHTKNAGMTMRRAMQRMSMMKKKEYKGTLINKKYPGKKKRWVYRAALKGGPQVV